jgi:acetyl esterase/lipase
MGKERNLCVIDEIKQDLIFGLVSSFKDEIESLAKQYAEPEKESPLTKYETESVLDELCETSDGRIFYMETFSPVISDDRKLPVIIYIHGGGFVVEDRRYVRQYLTSMASRGFIAIGFDYVMDGDTSIFGEIRNSCRIIKEVVSVRIKELNTDPDRIFMTGDSAGAYLALYVTAAQKSAKLRKVIGCEPSDLKITALGFHSGMFYIDRYDINGWLFSKHVCSMSKRELEFRRKYIDSECDEVIKNLPPVFLTTCRGDFLNEYTLAYHEALKKAGKRSHLVYKGSDDLIHAFPAITPYRSESIDVLDRMTLWFEEQVKEAKFEDL